MYGVLKVIKGALVKEQLILDNIEKSHWNHVLTDCVQSREFPEAKELLRGEVSKNECFKQSGRKEHNS